MWRSAPWTFSRKGDQRFRRCKDRHKDRSGLICFCASGHPLASQGEVCLRDLQKEKLALFILPKGPLSIAQVQGQLMGSGCFQNFISAIRRKKSLFWWHLVTVFWPSWLCCFRICRWLQSSRWKTPNWSLLEFIIGRSRAIRRWEPWSNVSGSILRSRLCRQQKKIMRFHTGQKLLMEAHYRYINCEKVQSRHKAKS